jgi:hypothetical protein
MPMRQRMETMGTAAGNYLSHPKRLGALEAAGRNCFKSVKTWTQFVWPDIPSVLYRCEFDIQSFVTWSPELEAWSLNSML